METWASAGPYERYMGRWSRRRGMEAYAKGDWAAAATNFSRTVPFSASNVVSLQQWGDALAMLGEWQEAAEVHGQAVEVSNRSFGAFWQCALLQLAAGDEAGYRAKCAELIQRFGDTDDANTALWIVLTCAATENSVDDINKIVSLANRAAEKADPRNPAFKTVLGAVQYRAGQNKEAIETLKKAIPLHVLAAFAAPRQLDAIQVSRLTGETILALAYHREGDKEAFDKQLAIVRAFIAQLKKSPPKPGTSIGPWAVLFAILMAERELTRIELTAAENK